MCVPVSSDLECEEVYKLCAWLEIGTIISLQLSWLTSLYIRSKLTIQGEVPRKMMIYNRQQRRKANCYLACLELWFAIQSILGPLWAAWTCSFNSCLLGKDKWQCLQHMAECFLSWWSCRLSYRAKDLLHITHRCVARFWLCCVSLCRLKLLSFWNRLSQR